MFSSGQIFRCKRPKNQHIPLIYSNLNTLTILLQISDKAVPLRQLNKKTKRYD